MAESEWNAYQKRNIMIFGRVGVGKKTIAKQFLNSKDFEHGSPMESVTREAIFDVLSGEDSTRNFLYKIALLDTVGPYSTKVSWKNIFKEIWVNPSEKVPEGINLFVFVFRMGIYCDEEIQIFTSILNHMKKEVQENCALVITGCENLGDKGRKLLVEDIKRDEATGAIAQLMGKGIFTVGFPPLKNVKEDLKEDFETGIASDTEALKDLAKTSGEMTPRTDILREKNVYSGRQQLINHLGNCNFL